jgi:hypothetical protein
VLLPLGYGGLDGVLLLAAGIAGGAVTAAAVWWTLTGAARHADRRRCSRPSPPPWSLSSSCWRQLRKPAVAGRA